MRKFLNTLRQNLGVTIAIAFVLVFSVAASVSALSSVANQTFSGEIKNIVINNPVGESINEVFGGTTAYDWNVGGDLNVTGDSTLTGEVTLSGAATVSGELGYLESYTATTATTTVTQAMSGTTFYLSGDTAKMTLPATTDAGQFYRFVIDGAITGNQTIVTSDLGNNIEGTLIVAGAVVDCDAEDTITFVADGENLGDYVELRFNGAKWFIGDSGALTASKLTCSAT